MGHDRGPSIHDNMQSNEEESDIKGIQMLINPLDEEEESDIGKYPNFNLIQHNTS